MSVGHIFAILTGIVGMVFMAYIEGKRKKY